MLRRARSGAARRGPQQPAPLAVTSQPGHPCLSAGGRDVGARRMTASGTGARPKVWSAQYGVLSRENGLSALHKHAYRVRFARLAHCVLKVDTTHGQDQPSAGFSLLVTDLLYYVKQRIGNGVVLTPLRHFFRGVGQARHDPVAGTADNPAVKAPVQRFP